MDEEQPNPLDPVDPLDMDLTNEPDEQVSIPPSRHPTPPPPPLPPGMQEEDLGLDEPEEEEKGPASLDGLTVTPSEAGNDTAILSSTFATTLYDDDPSDPEKHHKLILRKEKTPEPEYETDDDEKEKLSTIHEQDELGTMENLMAQG